MSSYPPLTGLLLLVLTLVLVFVEVRGHVPYNQSPKPCCLPYRFQAIVTPIRQFDVHDKKVRRVSRDWVNRMQVQEVVTFTKSGVQDVLSRTVTDFNKKVRYTITGDKCQSSPVNYGMLEPCMPDKAEHIGNSYLGLFEDKTKFMTWHFRRSTENRDVNMTISVTSDRCVPVMEHIQGRMGEFSTDTLVIFSNLTRDVDDDYFRVPVTCDNKVKARPDVRRMAVSGRG